MRTSPAQGSGDPETVPPWPGAEPKEAGEHTALDPPRWRSMSVPRCLQGQGNIPGGIFQRREGVGSGGSPSRPSPSCSSESKPCLEKLLTSPGRGGIQSCLDSSFGNLRPLWWESTTGFCRLWLGEEYREFCFRKDGAFLPSNKSTMCPQEPALDGAGGERNAEKLAAGRVSVTGINN